MTGSEYPTWLLSDPEPRGEERKLAGFLMRGWLGRVRLQDVEYWVNNRRTYQQLLELQHNIDAVPTDDQLVSYLEGEVELDIEALAKDILKNGLREPIILTFNKVLVDGNRRYLAYRWIQRRGTLQQREEFETIPAWVLRREFSDERNMLRVVTSYNFLDNFRRPWSDFVKAQLLWEEYTYKNLTYDDLYQLYGGPGFSKSKISEFVKTYELIVEFTETSPDSSTAMTKAAENFIWFQQLQRSYRDEIRNNDEFQHAIFENIRNDYVEKTDDLKNLKDVYANREAWVQFKRGDVRQAHLTQKIRSAIEQRQAQPDTLMAEINERLEKLLAQEWLVTGISREARVRFHKLAARIPGQIENADERIEYALRIIQNLTSEEIARLSEASLGSIRSALASLSMQAQATRSDDY